MLLIPEFEFHYKTLIHLLKAIRRKCHSKWISWSVFPLWFGKSFSRCFWHLWQPHYLQVHFDGIVSAWAHEKLLQWNDSNTNSESVIVRQLASREKGKKDSIQCIQSWWSSQVPTTLHLIPGAKPSGSKSPRQSTFVAPSPCRLFAVHHTILKTWKDHWHNLSEKVSGNVLVHPKWRCPLTKKLHSSRCPRLVEPQHNASRSTWWWTWCCRAFPDSTLVHSEDTAQTRSETLQIFPLLTYFHIFSQNQMKWLIFFTYEFEMLSLPDRTMSLVGWPNWAWEVPAAGYLAWMPPTMCRRIHQTPQTEAESECAGPEEDDCGCGNRKGTLEEKSHNIFNKHSGGLSLHICLIKGSFFFIPSTKRAKERERRSRPTGTWREDTLRTSAMPEIPKNKYMVLCCQFISFTQPSLYRCAWGPSGTNCSAMIPGERLFFLFFFKQMLKNK